MSVIKYAVFATLVALPVTIPATAEAKPPLREVSEIDNELYYIAIANEIAEICDGISGRRMKAIGVMWGLRSKANKLGYSDDEIRAYVESDTEKARMRAKGESYLAANGAKYGKPETFCALGRTEINKNSAIGVYLRAK
ncbi:DUF5333 domain-containing protein [Tropicibacter sp. R16_0]|uniref:DUF5333 domain-containing protein n=1 Tax=Tropicibacter sp. R16_0 TaxID=2821102 RepID=UPI00257016B8|nr:DUF5333 domain-containing protein [Tropicibacter sp. R16_0]